MIKLYGQNDPAITEYFEKLCKPQDPVLEEIRARAEAEGLPPIHVAVGDGLHLEVLTRAFGARKVVEIGTLAGYSGVCIARALPSDGVLYTFEFEPKHMEVAEESFKRAGMADKVRTFVGPALSTLPQIEPEGPFDLVFVDADKVNYPGYLRWAARNLRKGGALLADNTFAWGNIAKTQIDDPHHREAAIALREFNRLAVESGQFRTTILPTGEGLTLAVRI